MSMIKSHVHVKILGLERQRVLDESLLLSVLMYRSETVVKQKKERSRG